MENPVVRPTFTAAFFLWCICRDLSQTLKAQLKPWHKACSGLAEMEANTEIQDHPEGRSWTKF